MTEEKAITERRETGMSRVKNYMLSPEVKERFTEMMGRNAIYYLNQVLIVVANNPKLQECEPKSILVSAMRAASLKLSVDPARGEAWIIPYKNKATFQMGYKGVYELALRTGQYRFINVIKIYEGEEIVEDRMTGIHTIQGKATSTKIVAYMLYFQLLNGFEKTFYMTVQQIAEHAERYSQSYGYKDSPWNTPERPKMEMKTVLMNGLRKWGRFNSGDREIIEQIEAEHEFIGPDELPDESAVTIEQPVKHTENEIMGQLGFGDN